SWRVSAAGARDPEVETDLEVGGDDHSTIRTVLDVRDRNLVSGDVVRFYVRVTDNSPAGQSAVSPTITLRLPTMAERREESIGRNEDLLERTDDAARAAAELRCAMRDLERATSAANARRRAAQQGAGTGGEPGADASMTHDEAQPARQVLEQQERLASDV